VIPSVLAAGGILLFERVLVMAGKKKEQELAILTTLRAAIAAAGLNSSSAAKRANVAQPTIYRFIHHRSTLSLESADRLARSLGFGGIELVNPNGAGSPARSIKGVKALGVAVGAAIARKGVKASKGKKGVNSLPKGRVSLERAAKGPDRAFGVKKKAAGKRRKG